MKTAFKHIVIGIIIWFLSFIVGNLFMFLYIILSERIDLAQLSETNLYSVMNNLSAGKMRVTLFISHMFSFFIPALAIALLVYKKEWLQGLHIKCLGKWYDYIVGLIFLVVCLPFTLYLNYIGMQLPWPEFMQNSDTQAYHMMQTLFSDEGLLSIILNVLLIGGVAAIGEELIFRALIQGNLHKIVNPAAAIIFTGVFFGALHLQADGMIARIILGCILGYTFWISGTLWVPIVIHFLYNSIQVLMVEFSKEEVNLQLETQQDPGITWYVALFSFILSVGIAYYWYQLKRKYERT